MQHAACLTGLERSYPEIAGNLRVSLSSLFGGLHHVGLFGVRPPQDPWYAVPRTMHLKREVLQTSCGIEMPRWYTANGKFVTRVAANFVQSLCDLAACDDLLTEQETELGRPYVQVARVRLDIAWEMPLTTDGLLPLRHRCHGLPSPRGGVPQASGPAGGHVRGPQQRHAWRGGCARGRAARGRRVRGGRA